MLECMSSGEVASRLYLLGHGDVPVYLLQVGKQSWALIEGGITKHSEAVWNDLTERVNPEHVHWWLITHSHFDHCGALAALYPRLPHVQVLASSQTAANWQGESARAVIRRLNETLVGSPVPTVELCDIPVQIVADGERIVLGEWGRFDVIATPGHAPDQLAYYEPDKKLLFCGDALGDLHVPSMTWRPLMFDDVDAYRRGIGYLQRLDVECLVPGHGGAVVGSDVRAFMTSAGLAADQLISRYQRHVVNGGDVDTLASTLTRAWGADNCSYISSSLHRKSMQVMLAAVHKYLKVKTYE